MSIPSREQIKIGIRVSVETKENQGTDKLTQGIVKEILTSSQIHPHGIKVSLESGKVGRVKQIEEEEQSKETTKEPVDLDKMNIPKTEDTHNEFKEFYQYDKKILEVDIKHRAEMKYAAVERIGIAVCSFGNSYEGGFVYLGINSDGNIVGLEQDLKLGEFSDYTDSFANHMVGKFENMTNDKVFVTSKVRIKFRKINDKTICIIQILPAERPVYLHGKEKSFFVRGASPKAIKFDVDGQFKYIKHRFPEYGWGGIVE